jgi:hypothetical protein
MNKIISTISTLVVIGFVRSLGAITLLDMPNESSFAGAKSMINSNSAMIQALQSGVQSGVTTTTVNNFNVLTNSTFDGTVTVTGMVTAVSGITATTGKVSVITGNVLTITNSITCAVGTNTTSVNTPTVNGTTINANNIICTNAMTSAVTSNTTVNTTNLNVTTGTVTLPALSVASAALASKAQLVASVTASIATNGNGGTNIITITAKDLNDVAIVFPTEFTFFYSTNTMFMLGAIPGSNDITSGLLVHSEESKTVLKLASTNYTGTFVMSITNAPGYTNWINISTPCGRVYQYKNAFNLP